MPTDSVFPVFNDILTKMEKPAASEQFKSNVQSILDAVNEYVSEVTGYTDLSTPQTCTLQNVYYARNILLPYRPIASIDEMVGRSIGSTDSAIEYDIVDTDRGVFQLSCGGSSFGRKYWARNKWDVVTVTYTPTPYLPKKLKNAILDACVYLYHRGGSGAIKDQRRGPITHTLMEKNLPPWVTTMISLERRTGAVLWV